VMKEHDAPRFVAPALDLALEKIKNAARNFRALQDWFIAPPLLGERAGVRAVRISPSRNFAGNCRFSTLYTTVVSQS